jgi:hypothetical protein
MGGFALVFPFDMPEREMQNGILKNSSGNSTKINLRATIYRLVVWSMKIAYLFKIQYRIFFKT